MDKGYVIEEEGLIKGAEESYPYVITLTYHGTRCGYVKVSPELAPSIEEKLSDVVHGGITYTGYRFKQDGDDDSYYIGFDCSHADDLPDIEAFKEHFKEHRDYGVIIKIIEQMSELKGIGCETRTLEYVRDNCEHLANSIDQLKHN